MTYIREINPRLRSSFTEERFLACRCSLMDWMAVVPTKEEIRSIKKKLPVSAKPVEINVISKDSDNSYVIDVKYVCRI